MKRGTYIPLRISNPRNDWLRYCGDLAPSHPSTPESSRPCCFSICWNKTFLQTRGAMLKIQIGCNLMQCSHPPSLPTKKWISLFSQRPLSNSEIFLDTTMSIYLRPCRKVRDGQKHFKCDLCVSEKITSPPQTMPTSVQFSSVTQLCLTLCNPVDYSTPGFPVHHQYPELAQTHVHWIGDAIQPSHPLLSPSPPAFNLS